MAESRRKQMKSPGGPSEYRAHHQSDNRTYQYRDDASERPANHSAKNHTCNGANYAVCAVYVFLHISLLTPFYDKDKLTEEIITLYLAVLSYFLVKVLIYDSQISLQCQYTRPYATIEHRENLSIGMERHQYQHIGHRLNHRYDTEAGILEVLRDVSLEVAPSEFVSLIGPSGCGKTTLLRAIGGLTDATSGSISLSGDTPQDLQRRKGIGFVSQDAALLAWRTALENVRLPFQLNAGSRGSDTIATAEQTLNAVGLSDFASYYPHQLSGGMRQRVAFARALAFGPGLLLMDEPLSALDEMTREEMRYELLQLWERQRPTVIFVTHSIAEAVRTVGQGSGSLRAARADR